MGISHKFEQDSSTRPPYYAQVIRWLTLCLGWFNNPNTVDNCKQKLVNTCNFMSLYKFTLFFPTVKRYNPKISCHSTLAIETKLKKLKLCEKVGFSLRRSHLLCISVMTTVLCCGCNSCHQKEMRHKGTWFVHYICTVVSRVQLLVACKRAPVRLKPCVIAKKIQPIVLAIIYTEAVT